MNMMNADDVLAVEQTAYFYEQAYGTGGHLHHIPAVFSVADDASIHANVSISGHDAIKAQYVEYYDGTPLYDTYHCGQQICTPVIELNGDKARGQFPTSGFFINCCAGIPPREIPEPPYTVNSTFEVWYHDFICEHHLWKIHHMHFAALAGFNMMDPFWSWNPADDGLAARTLLHTLSTPFPIMEYMADLARWEVSRYEMQ